MNNQFKKYIKTSLCIVVYIISWSAQANNSSIDIAKLNWQKEGTYHIPALHGNIQVANNMHLLYGDDLTKVKTIDPSISPLTGAIIIIILGSSAQILQIAAIEDKRFKMFTFDKRDLDEYMAGFYESYYQKNSVLSQGSSQKHTIKMIGEPVFNQEFKTIFLQAEENNTQTTPTYLFANKFGQQSMVFFSLRIPKDESPLFKETFESFVKHFTFDPGFEYSEKPFNDFINAIMFISCCLLALIALLFIIMLIWRIKTKSGNKKIAADLILCGIITFLTEARKLGCHNSGKQTLTYTLGGMTALFLFTFFIFFFWSWKPSDVQFRTARTIIKSLFYFFVFLFSFSAVANIITTPSRENLLFFACLLILLSLIVWKYKRLMTPIRQNSDTTK